MAELMGELHSRISHFSKVKKLDSINLDLTLLVAISKAVNRSSEIVDFLAVHNFC
jgi:hypothetical protein